MSNHHSHEHHDYSSHEHIPQDKKILALSFAIITGFMVVEFVGGRWQNPIEMMALSMLGVASLGLLINLLVAKIMLNSDHDNLNIKAAYLHVLTDLFGSIIAILSGISAYFLGWLWVDPLASMILSVLVLKSGMSAFRLALKNI